MVTTELGRLHVSVTGDGPPVVLWHSLFVDSGSWRSVIDGLGRRRTVYAIDGPSHGRSDPVPRDFSIPECVDAATQALDVLGLSEPIDWVGNAWGGHVGIRLATGPKPRLRSLVTIGTPVRGFTPWEKLTKGWPLVWTYQRFGAVGLITKALSDSLLGPESVAAQPELTTAIIDSFRRADRTGMTHAVRSLMLHRSGIESLLSDITVPTLVMSVRGDVMGWRPAEARATCAAIPDCRVEVVEGTGHISPLVVDAQHVEQVIADFWDRQDASPYRPSRA
jgi:pimeloyl-ACP methyl ester carboxylesterase